MSSSGTLKVMNKVYFGLIISFFSLVALAEDSSQLGYVPQSNLALLDNTNPGTEEHLRAEASQLADAYLNGLDLRMPASQESEDTPAN